MRMFAPLIAGFVLIVAIAGMFQPPSLFAQAQIQPENPEDSRTALRRALAEQKAAEQRALAREREAAQANEAARKSASEAAALAARIQQSEAELAARQAQLRLIGAQRRQLQARLAQRQQPVVELTAALQNLSRRPLALALLRPGSVRDMVYLRAVLASTLPEVQARTAALRAELDQLQALEDAGVQAIKNARATEAELEQRRTRMAALAARQRVLAREKGATAQREATRALAMAEEARDLDALVGKLDAAGQLRRELAALPGPLLRPAQPEQAAVSSVQDASPAPSASAAAPARYQLPVLGRVVAGFGAVSASGARSQGLTIAPAGRAQVVAPAAGRVAFAGAYRGYGQIVIIEHQGGWTSLITGLGQADVGVGQELVPGAPLGQSGDDGRAVMLELRRDGVPVNPIDHLR